MAFWTENTTEPKRNFRWRVRMANLTGGTLGTLPGADSDVVWWAKTVDTPSYNVTDVTHSFFDNEYKFPGRVQWQDVSMTLVDPISPNAVYITNQIVLASGYSIKGNDAINMANNLKPTSITKSAANLAVGNVFMDIFSGTGEIVESWEMKNPFITSVKFSTLDYTNDDMRTIDLTWKYDYAKCLSNDTSGSPYAGGSQFDLT
tara:strand:+ start:1952 stop:2560 length:609 start_codon:yes stop_codon:yes gene_type:complete